MRYLGGKTRTAKRIVETLPAAEVYIEPFVGGGSVAAAAALSSKFEQVYLSDANEDLMLLWEAGIRQNYKPPRVMSKEEYEALKEAKPSALRAWACFAASHSGKPWGGYGTTAPTAGRDYLNEAANLFEKRCAALRQDNVHGKIADYRELEYPDGAVVYADPPYADTVGYGDAFDSAEFWQTMTRLSERCRVFVSEYAAPDSWRSCWSIERAATVDPTRLTNKHREPLHTMNVLAVDPGAAHVGVAVYLNREIRAREIDADKWLKQFSMAVRDFDVVVIEAFVLYPHKAMTQSWSPMETSEMIGAMKWIASEAGVEVVEQGADIKIPTRHQCVARRLHYKHSSGHASDALLHLYYFLLRHEMEV